jgi:hypothetical protein
MAQHKFQFLINQTPEKESTSIGCAIATGWTDGNNQPTNIKENVSQAFQSWLTTQDGKEYINEDDSIVNYNIVDLSEAINIYSSLHNTMASYHIYNLNIEIFNTIEDWKLDDTLAVASNI